MPSITRHDAGCHMDNLQIAGLCNTLFLVPNFGPTSERTDQGVPGSLSTIWNTLMPDQRSDYSFIQSQFSQFVGAIEAFSSNNSVWDIWVSTLKNGQHFRVLTLSGSKENACGRWTGSGPSCEARLCGDSCLPAGCLSMPQGACPCLCERSVSQRKRGCRVRAGGFHLANAVSDCGSFPRDRTQNSSATRKTSPLSALEENTH